MTDAFKMETKKMTTVALNLETEKLARIGRLTTKTTGFAKTLFTQSTTTTDLRHFYASLRDHVVTGDDGQGDGFVGACLDWLGVRHVDARLDLGDDGDVVAGLLADLLAVVVAVAVSVAVALRGRLADGHHLGLAHLLKGDLNSLAVGGLGLGLVGVGADLVVDLLGALGTDGPGNIVALLDILDVLPGELDGSADSLKGRGAHLSNLNNIQN